MKNLKALTLVGLVMALTLIGPQAYAQGTSSGGDKWVFSLTPYFWMAGLEGDVGAKGTTAHIDFSFSDIWDHLDYGGEIHMEAWKGDRWGLFLDATYLKLSADEIGTHDILGPVSVDINLGEWLVEFGGLYQLGTWPLGKNEGRALSLQALGGGRYWNLNMRLDASTLLPGVGRNINETKDWVDPFIGARAVVDLTKKLSLVLRGDIGGFGVGSKFSWDASAIFGYHFSPMISAWLGYKALGVDYETGSYHRKFEFDVTMYGPIVGLGIQF
jgi:hypothetical protein